jgi:hypothetical protein
VYYQIGAGNLYRVTSDHTIWPVPVKGDGAFYLPRGGNRYNVVQQVTVSCSEDSWVVICEAAYYQALKLRDAIASSLINELTYPFRSEQRFWGFRINPLPPVLDLEDPVAEGLFQYSPHVLTNPGQNYLATQSVSNAVRTHTPPMGSPDPIPEGIFAPSVRTPKSGAYQPKQLALFIPRPGSLLPRQERSSQAFNHGKHRRTRKKKSRSEFSFPCISVPSVVNLLSPESRGRRLLHRIG